MKTQHLKHPRSHTHSLTFSCPHPSPTSVLTHPFYFPLKVQLRWLVLQDAIPYPITQWNICYCELNSAFLWCLSLPFIFLHWCLSCLLFNFIFPTFQPLCENSLMKWFSCFNCFSISSSDILLDHLFFFKSIPSRIWVPSIKSGTLIFLIQRMSPDTRPALTLWRSRGLGSAACFCSCHKGILSFLLDYNLHLCTS